MMIDSEIEFELDTTEIADEVRQSLESEVEQIVEITIQNFDFDDQVETAVSRLELNDYLDHDQIRYNIEDDISEYVIGNMDIEEHVTDALYNIDLSEYVDVDDITSEVREELVEYEMLHNKMSDMSRKLIDLEMEILRLNTPLWIRIVNKIRGWF